MLLYALGMHYHIDNYCLDKTPLHRAPVEFCALFQCARVVAVQCAHGAETQL